MAYDKNNIFAKILRGEMPATKVYEDAATLAFMDIFPQSKGHTLVIPKTDAENILDIPPAALADLVQKTQTIAKAVKKALGPEGIMIMQMNGSVAGQTVFHIHFHIIPRWPDEPFRLHAHSNMADKDELAKLAAQIKAAL